METYQSIQNRTAQTFAVIKQYMPDLQSGGVTIAGLIERSLALSALAQARDDALAASDLADSAEHQAFLFLQALVLALPRVVENELNDAISAEAALLQLLGPVFAVAPRSTEAALERGQKLLSTLKQVNPYLASLTPPRGPVASGGQGIAELAAALDAQPALVQAVADRNTDVSIARSALSAAASELNRLNKRFYSRLKAEARSDAQLAAALGHITTENANLPATLSIRRVTQGGIDNRQVLVSYRSGAFAADTTSSIEWQVDGASQGFDHSAAADPSGNALGPFAAGATVRLRTRVRNGNGSTTGSVRTLEIR